MKILLLGEYSNVHWTLAEGLRKLGHEALVVSNGDFWKNYPRDIDLSREKTHWGGIKLMAKLITILPKLRGFDVVQIINPMFLELKAERILPIYKYLLKHNKKMFLGAFGLDYYWIDLCCNRRTLKYDDYHVGNQERIYPQAEEWKNEWLNPFRKEMNEYMAKTSNAIITGLYEYWEAYHPVFPDKTTFVPFPIKPEENDLNTENSAISSTIKSEDNAVSSLLNPEYSANIANNASGEVENIINKSSIEKTEKRPLKLFIGVNKERSEYKGTDIMLRAAKDVAKKYPELIELQIAESVPFAEYQAMMNGSDAILDQLYAYTPSMNPLLAMSKGIICIGGGEPENYEIINEKELRPIINVEPNYESVFSEIEKLALHPERIPELKRQSIEYIKRHHDYLKVAKAYEEIYLKY